MYVRLVTTVTVPPGEFALRLRMYHSERKQVYLSRKLPSLQASADETERVDFCGHGRNRAVRRKCMRMTEQVQTSTSCANGLVPVFARAGNDSICCIPIISHFFKFGNQRSWELGQFRLTKRG